MSYAQSDLEAFIFVAYCFPHVAKHLTHLLDEINKCACLICHNMAKYSNPRSKYFEMMKTDGN